MCCSLSCVACIIVTLIVVYWYGPELLTDLDNMKYDFFECDGDASMCNPSRRSINSCCSLNPTIHSQLRQMDSFFSFFFREKGCGDGLCLPNIGSNYVGASVASIRDTVPYKHPQGSPTSEASNRPELVLEPSAVTLGKNWHFTGVGTLVIKLFQPSQISGFTIVHPKACQIPEGHQFSAPKCFYAVGMNELNESEPFPFGNFSYHLGGESSQTFPVQYCSTDSFQLIEFRFVSNHGNPNYTALYKVRIHGVMGPPDGVMTDLKEGSKND